MVAVIGCGNPNRRDDGVGPEVVRALRARDFVRNMPQVSLLDAGTDGMAVMFAARGCRMLIIVDACQSGSPSGAVFEVPGDELAQERRPSFTTHDFRWDHALFAGRRIFREDFPTAVTVFLVEAVTVELGIGLSPCVADAVATVVDRIETLLRARLAEPASFHVQERLRS